MVMKGKPIEQLSHSKNYCEGLTFKSQRQ